MRRFTVYLIAILLFLGFNKMGFAGIHTWDLLTENNGKVIPLQKDQLKQKHVDPAFLAQLLQDVKAAVSAADSNSDYLDNKIVVEGLIKSILLPGANEQLKLLNEQKVKMNSGATGGYLFDLLTSDRLISIVQQANNILIKLGLINGLAGATLSDDLVLLTERTTDNSLYKIAQDSLRSWSNRLWYTETLNNSSIIAVPEDTDFSMSMLSLGSGGTEFMKNKRCVWGYSDSKARFLGRLISIGRDGDSYTDAALIKLRGERVVISAADYSGTLNEQCWFSVQSESASSVPAWFFKISDYYGAAKQIDHVINAVFEFHYPLSGGNPLTDGRWVLVDYECMPQKFWRDSDVLITQDGPTGDYTIQIPNINKFPMNGYYQFFAHIDLVATWEWNSYNGVPNTSELYKTILVQLIDSDGTQPKIKTPNHINTLGLKPGCPAECCCTISGNHNHYWIDVQGFAHINSPDCTGRYFSLKVIKPTGALITTWDITFCTWEVHYLGRKKAAYCNPPV